MTPDARPQPSTRADFARFVPALTRWNDNDAYGHVNNVVYYEFFDTAVNQILVEAGVLAPSSSEIIGLVVETRCTYFSSIAFPDAIEVGVAVVHIGRSSVRYRIGIFKAGVGDAAAQGEFTHVYVERARQTPVPIPADVRHIMEALTV